MSTSFTMTSTLTVNNSTDNLKLDSTYAENISTGTYPSKNQINVFANADNNFGNANIFSLAKAFLSISSMTHKKLQKLCYYAKAWYLALYDQNLIPEQFQAWVHGAVQPALYHEYKQYGYEYIPRIINIADIPEEFLSFAQEIYDSYGNLSGDELEQINHQEYPWIHARGNCKPWESCNHEISETDMKDFFRKMMKVNGQNTETESF